MSELAFLQPGGGLPVELEGRNVTGEHLSATELLDRYDRLLVYFYPFEDRDLPPPAWRLLEDHADRLEDARLGVVGIRGPAEATREAPVRGDAFPVLEDHNYRLGQAVGVLGGRSGDDVGTKDVPRALVLLDKNARVVRAERGDDPAVLRRMLDDVLPG